MSSLVQNKPTSKVESKINQQLYKGQLISKCLFGIFNSSKKQRKKIDFTTMEPQFHLFSLIIWKH